MPAWTLFAVVAFLATAGFVLLARASARALRDPSAGLRPSPPPEGTVETGDAPDAFAAADRTGRPAGPAAALDSTPVLLANVLTTHGVLAVLLLGTAWFADVPPDALGLAPPSPATLGVGAALGLTLAAANETGARVATRLGHEHDDWLRELLAPDTPAGWAGLLLLGLPVVAGAEELLFRGVLVGGLAAGFGWSTPLLVVLSSALFGLGHSLQGTGGVVVTALLGGALAVAFVATGSLAVVVVAHYVVNAVEFVVHEWPPAGGRRA